MPILQIEKDQDDEPLEMEFELKFIATLTLAQRFEMLEERRQAVMEQLIRYGHRKPFEIIQRS